MFMTGLITDDLWVAAYVIVPVIFGHYSGDPVVPASLVHVGDTTKHTILTLLLFV